MNAVRWSIVSLAIAAAMAGSIATAQDGANQATLAANGRKLTFKQVVALRGETSGEPRVIVLATGQKLSPDVLKQVQKKGAEDSVGSEVDQPYLKAVYRENGELLSLIGQGGGLSFSTHGGSLEGKAEIQNGRIKGTAKLVETGNFAKDVSMSFDVPIGVDTTASPAVLDPPVKPLVEGKFTGNGKEGNLKFLLVEEREPFSDKAAIRLVFTEKDPAKSRNPGFDAGFGKLGNALILSVNVNGGIFGCEVAHSAHSKSPFSAIGEIQMGEFDLAGGNVKGQVSTNGPVDAFGQKWEVDFKFAAPLPEKMRAAMAQPTESPAKTAKSNSPAPKKPVKEKPAGPMIAARKLALPADAKNVQHKQLVQHITFDSGLPVRQVVAEFSAKLKEQGWQEAPGGLIGPQNAIMKRTQGAANLTIMIQPSGTGSQVKVFTEGLDWKADDGQKSEAAPDAGLDKETSDLIKKALKNVPKGVLDDQ